MNQHSVIFWFLSVARTVFGNNRAIVFRRGMLDGVVFMMSLFDGNHPLIRICKCLHFITINVAVHRGLDLVDVTIQIDIANDYPRPLAIWEQ